MTKEENFPKNDRKEIFGWMLYDWANSAFYTSVVAVLLGPYLIALAESAVGKDGVILDLYFFRVTPGGFPAFCIALSVVSMVVLLPILGAIADYTHLKKRMMAIFCYALLSAAQWRHAAWRLYTPHELLWCGNVISDPYMFLVNVVGPAAAVCAAILVRRCVQSRRWPVLANLALLAFALTSAGLIYEGRLLHEGGLPLGRILWLAWL